MAAFKLRHWPFIKDEVAELYWLCSPRQDAENRWHIKAVFLDSKNELKEVIYPWGTLPVLRLGQRYQNGTYCDNDVRGSTLELNIPSVVKFETCIGFEMPKSLYSFYKKPEYGNQHVCKFEISGRIYFIPCMEIVRSILAPYRFLANRILRPNGLDDLIESYSGRNIVLELNLTEEYPRQLLNDTTLGYLAWLRFDQAAHYAWNSVYSNMFKKAAALYPSYPAKAFKKGIPIEAFAPMNGKSTWTYRGVTYGNSTLILELMFRSDLNNPYDHILCNHPSMEKIETDDKPKGTRENKNDNAEQEVELDATGQPARKQENQTMVEQPPVMFSFRKNPQIVRMRKKKRMVHTGEPEEVKTGDIGDDERDASKPQIVTTQDWELEGKVAPIEFKMLEVVNVNPYRGLEDFIKAVEYLMKMRPSWDVSMCTVYLPLGKGFSKYDDGNRRGCSIVKISRQGRRPCYIVEVARPDKWPISTLFMWPMVNDQENDVVERTLDKILNVMVENNGHWDQAFLKQKENFYFDTAKHLSGQTVVRWAERIAEKASK